MQDETRCECGRSINPEDGGICYDCLVKDGVLEEQGRWEGEEGRMSRAEGGERGQTRQ